MSEKKKEARKDPAERREELIDAAIAAIRRDGAQISMDKMAKEAGITKPILYSNFGDKAGLADAIAQRFVRELAHQFSEAWATTEDTRERIQMGIEIWVNYIEADPVVYYFLSEGTFGAGQLAQDRRLVNMLARVIARALGEWLRDQGADSGAAEPWAYGTVGLVHTITEWWLERRTLSKRDLIMYLTSLIWSGLSGNGLALGNEPTSEAETISLQAVQEARRRPSS